MNTIRFVLVLFIFNSFNSMHATNRKDPCTDLIGLAVLNTIRDAYPGADVYGVLNELSTDRLNRTESGVACTREWLKTAKVDPEQRESFKCWLDYDEGQVAKGRDILAHPAHKPVEWQKYLDESKAYEKTHKIPKPQCSQKGTK